MTSPRSVLAPAPKPRPTAVASAAPLSLCSRGPCAALLNARAKRVGKRTALSFAQLLGEPNVYLTRSLEEAERAVEAILAGGYRTLLVGGGDGTIAAALQLLDRAARRMKVYGLPELVVLRLGTGNALASMAGAGPPLEDARRVLEGRLGDGARTLRVLESPGRDALFPFGSLGYDAQVLNDYVDVLSTTRSPLRQRLGRSLGGYLYAIATRTIPTELRRGPSRVRVLTRGRASLVDQSTLEEIPLSAGSLLFEGEARAVLFGSTPFYGYGIKVLPYAQRRPDRFQVRVSAASISYLISRLPALWSGRLRSSRLVDFLVEDVRIEVERPLPLQLSGDAMGKVRSLDVRLADRSFDLRTV